MKKDNRIIWVVTIAGLLASITWLYKHPLVVKKTVQSAIVDSLSDDSVRIADSLAYSFYAERSSGDSVAAKPAGSIKYQKAELIGTVDLIIDSGAQNIAAVKITHHWNMPDCDSLKSVSPCKVAIANGFTEYNLHRQ